ncbi:MAG TPA: ankyrin repeat domain-containing protein [Pyrinomonadaceae bacterium]|nr:ankyrin repeat domain-containing protein [Pyrinomonadaceae bacterium]
MRPIFSIKLCVLLILGSFAAKVPAQSVLKKGVASPRANNRQTSVSGESECIKKAEVRRHVFAVMASRVEGSALMRAAGKGQILTVKTLLRRGVNVNQKNAISMTPLMLAVGAGHIEVVKALLAAGADPNAEGGIAHGPIFSVMTMAMISSNKNRVGLLDALIASGSKTSGIRHGVT